MIEISERERRLTEQLVTYTVEVDGRVVIVENVPARVDDESGERFFSPATVERIQTIVWGDRAPDRIAETPVFHFAA
ncbi:MAG TPA: YgiT-type zinc finger protein [Longimicrobium sp.]|jgi:YgiT-type zinc finger domain-containing protein